MSARLRFARGARARRSPYGQSISGFALLALDRPVPGYCRLPRSVRRSRAVFAGARRTPFMALMSNPVDASGIARSEAGMLHGVRTG